MRYWDGPEGRRYCFTTEPLMECPNVPEPQREAGSGYVVTAVAKAVAAALSTTEQDACRVLRRAHSGSRGHRRRVDGKLTDRCDSCGAKMRNRGYFAYVEEPVPEEELTSLQRTSAALNARLSGNATQYRRIRDVQVDTRREAKAWAWDELKADKAIEAEKAAI